MLLAVVTLSEALPTQGSHALLPGSPTMSAPAMRPLLRAKLASRPANGHVSFIPQIRKLVFEYCEKWPSSNNTRTFVKNHLEDLARTNPHVEIVIRQRNYKEPIVRGFYCPCILIVVKLSTQLMLSQ